MNLSIKKNRALVAVQEVEAGQATILSKNQSTTSYVCNAYPELVVSTELPFSDHRPYLKRPPAKDRDMLLQAIANILLNQQGVGVETFLIETDLGLYLVRDRVEAITDTSGLDFSHLAAGIRAAGILPMHPVLDQNTCGFKYSPTAGTLTVVGSGSIPIDLAFDPSFVAAEFADSDDIQPPSCNPTQEAISCEKVYNGTNWTINVTWNVVTERTIRWMAYQPTNTLMIYDTSQFVPFKTTGALDLGYLAQYIDREGDLEDSILRDESLWIQDTYFAIIQIIQSRRWMSYFIDGHFDSYFTDISTGDSFFQTTYNYTLMYLMRDLAEQSDAKQRFSISNDKDYEK